MAKASKKSGESRQYGNQRRRQMSMAGQQHRNTKKSLAKKSYEIIWHREWLSETSRNGISERNISVAAAFSFNRTNRRKASKR